MSFTFYLFACLLVGIFCVPHLYIFAQLNNPTKNDWCETIRNDLKTTNIECSFSQIQEMSKNKFKKLVKKKIYECALKDLKLSIKTKGSNLYFDRMMIKNYLLSPNLSTKQKQFIFRARTIMIDIKSNMKTGQSNIFCDLCSLEGIKVEETQKHIFYCPITSKKGEMPKYQYEDLFSNNINKVSVVGKLLLEKIEIRGKIQENSRNS